MAAYITVGATTTHGGKVITGSPYTTHNGVQVSRKGDKVICKKCKKVTTILTGDPSFIVDGAPIARGGDMTSCGATLIAIQQSFAESDFEVFGVEQPEPTFEQPAPLQFPKSDPDALFASLAPKSDEIFMIRMGRVEMAHSNEFAPLKPSSYDSKVANDKIKLTVNIAKGSYTKLLVLMNNMEIATKTGSFNANDSIDIIWDGFIKDKYDSTWFTKDKVEFTVIGTNSKGGQDKHSSQHRFEYKQCDWLDIKINRSTKRIDVNLRVAISEISKVHVEKRRLIPLVPPAEIKRHNNKPIIEKINITDNEIKSLAKQSVSRYWSRNNSTLMGKQNHPIGIDLNGDKYEVFTTCEITGNNSLNKVDIKFNTNTNIARSRNWELSRIVYYNVGYIKYPNRWDYITETDAKEAFSKTFSHELGHDILLAYGGHSYSKGHKGSSTVTTQKVNGTYQNIGNEYDLMKYAKRSPLDIYDKAVASEEDVRSFLWLSMIKIVPLVSRG
nr:PAAR domain-containing protein [uncultured Psychrobacter sp.]